MFKLITTYKSTIRTVHSYYKKMIVRFHQVVQAIQDHPYTQYVKDFQVRALQVQQVIQTASEYQDSVGDYWQMLVDNRDTILLVTVSLIIFLTLYAEMQRLEAEPVRIKKKTRVIKYKKS